MNLSQKSAALLSLKQVMDSYYPLSVETWDLLLPIFEFRSLAAHSVLYSSGKIPNSFSYVYKGLFRVFISDQNGNEYNKNFFDEGTFPGSMAALLKNTPSKFSIESLEPSLIICIDFKAYRKLLHEREDLKLFHIFYLEKNWLLAKDAREVELVQEDAGQRYARFLQTHGEISKRLPQYHIASHLGITPTQLSRIRKKT